MDLNTLLLVMGIVLVAVGCLLAHRGPLPYTSFCIGPEPSNPPIPTRSIRSVERVDDGVVRIVDDGVDRWHSDAGGVGHTISASKKSPFTDSTDGAKGLVDDHKPYRHKPLGSMVS